MNAIRSAGSSLLSQVVGFAALALAAACHPGGGGSSGPADESYLGVAVNVDAMFRWTPRVGTTTTLVPIEVDDVALPAGLSATDARAVYASGRDAWLTAMENLDFGTSTRFKTENSYPSTRFVVRVTFVQTLTGSRVGQVDTVRSNDRIVGMTLRQAVRSPLDNRMLTLTEMKQSMTHELGHAFGFIGFSGATGHSPKSGDIMFSEINGDSPQLLSGSDRLTLRDLYLRQPQILRRED